MLKLEEIIQAMQQAKQASGGKTERDFEEIVTLLSELQQSSEVVPEDDEEASKKLADVEKYENNLLDLARAYMEKADSRSKEHQEAVQQVIFYVKEQQATKATLAKDMSTAVNKLHEAAEMALNMEKNLYAILELPMEYNGYHLGKDFTTRENFFKNVCKTPLAELGRCQDVHFKLYLMTLGGLSKEEMYELGKKQPSKELLDKVTGLKTDFVDMVFQGDLEKIADMYAMYGERIEKEMIPNLMKCTNPSEVANNAFENALAEGNSSFLQQTLCLHGYSSRTPGQDQLIARINEKLQAKGVSHKLEELESFPYFLAGMIQHTKVLMSQRWKPSELQMEDVQAFLSKKMTNEQLDALEYKTMNRVFCFMDTIIDSNPKAREAGLDSTKISWGKEILGILDISATYEYHPQLYSKVLVDKLPDTKVMSEEVREVQALQRAWNEIGNKDKLKQLDDLIAALDDGNMIFRSSNSEYGVMRREAKKLRDLYRKEPTPENIKAIHKQAEALSVAAKEYSLYKVGNENAFTTDNLSDNARRRLAAAKKVLDFTKELNVKFSVEAGTNKAVNEIVTAKENAEILQKRKIQIAREKCAEQLYELQVKKNPKFDDRKVYEDFMNKVQNTKAVEMMMENPELVKSKAEELLQSAVSEMMEKNSGAAQKVQEKTMTKQVEQQAPDMGINI